MFYQSIPSIWETGLQIDQFSSRVCYLLSIILTVLLVHGPLFKSLVLINSISFPQPGTRPRLTRTVDVVGVVVNTPPPRLRPRLRSDVALDIYRLITTTSFSHRFYNHYGIYWSILYLILVQKPLASRTSSQLHCEPGTPPWLPAIDIILLLHQCVLLSLSQ